MTPDDAFALWRVERERSRPAPLAKRQQLTLSSRPSGESALLVGKARWARMDALIEQMGGKRWPLHKEFHDAMKLSCLHYLYQECFEVARDRVLELHGLTPETYKILCLIQAPRRFGKTTSVSQFVAAYLACVPNASVCVFSSGKRASGELTAKVLANLSRVRANIAVQNSETIIVAGEARGDARKLKSLGSNVKGNKGQGGNLIVLEEAAVISPQMLSEVITPLIKVSGTSFIAISTPIAESRFTDLVEKKHSVTGEPLFATKKIELLCQDCKRQKLLACPHVDHLIPPWLRDTSRNEAAMALMGDGVDDGTFQQEVLGVAGASLNRVFAQETLDRLMASSVNAPITPLDHIFVVIDPSGGGSSRFAMVTGLYRPGAGGSYLLLNAESWNVVDDSDLETVIPTYIGQMLDTYGLAQTRVIRSIIERNYGGSPLSSRIAHLLSRKCSVQHFTPDCRRIGVWTDAANKERMRISLTEILAAARLGFHSKFFSRQTGSRAKLVEELKTFRYVHRATSEFGNARRALTGKINGKNDDLAMCVMMLVFWVPLSLKNPACFRGY